MNVLFCSLSDRPKLSDKIYEKLEEYCLYHNYDLVIEKESLDKSRAPPWSKILLLIRELKNNPKKDLIVWIDDDILITNKQLKFHEIIQEYSFENILLSEEIIPPFNTGIIVCKNNQGTIDYLNEIYKLGENTKYIKSPNWEQQIMINHYHKMTANNSFQTIIKTIPYKVIQSFYRCDNKDWKLGDFSCHLTGMPMKQRLKYRDQILKEISN